jgi:hypothetical protein
MSNRDMSINLVAKMLFANVGELTHRDIEINREEIKEGKYVYSYSGLGLSMGQGTIEEIVFFSAFKIFVERRGVIIDVFDGSRTDITKDLVLSFFEYIANHEYIETGFRDGVGFNRVDMSVVNKFKNLDEEDRHDRMHDGVINIERFIVAMLIDDECLCYIKPLQPIILDEWYDWGTYQHDLKKNR